MVTKVSLQSYQMAKFLLEKLTVPPKENPRLDPLSTLVKLAILSKKPEGTKLSLESNYITFTEPYHWTIQALIRTYQRDSYNDLRDLTKTLHKAIEWYGKDLDIQKIIILAIQGLEKLKRTYGNTGKADAVQSYIDILNGTKTEEHSSKEKEIDQSNFTEKEDMTSDSESDDDLLSPDQFTLNNQIEETSESKEKTFESKKNLEQRNLDEVKLHQILKSVWDPNDVKIILGFFERIQKASNEEEINDSIKGIEVILKSNHKKIEEQVKILSSIQ